MKSPKNHLKYFGITICLTVLSHTANAEILFGKDKDIKFANKLWEELKDEKLVGRHAIGGIPYIGQAPHGNHLETFESIIKVMNRKSAVIVKRNYMAASKLDILNNRDQYLDAITVMFKREAGYDTAQQDWFYVKYAPDGSILNNPQGVALAGRVGASTDMAPQACIGCHQNAGGGDYVFIHDRPIPNASTRSRYSNSNSDSDD